MARTWPEHGNSMARAWQEHGNSMTTAWQERGNSMARACQDFIGYEDEDGDEDEHEDGCALRNANMLPQLPRHSLHGIPNFQTS